MYRSHINSAFTYCSNLLSTHVKYGAEAVTRFVNDQSFPVTMSNRSYAFESLFTMPNPADVAGSSRWLTADKNAPESPVVLPFFQRNENLELGPAIALQDSIRLDSLNTQGCGIIEQQL